MSWAFKLDHFQHMQPFDSRMGPFINTQEENWVIHPTHARVTPAACSTQTAILKRSTTIPRLLWHSGIRTEFKKSTVSCLIDET